MHATSENLLGQRHIMKKPGNSIQADMIWGSHGCGGIIAEQAGESSDLDVTCCRPVLPTA